MKKSIKITWPLVAVFGVLFFAGCASEEEDEKPKRPVESEYFEGVATKFEGKKFKNAVHEDILKELGVCEFASSDSTYYATCSPENFSISAYKNDGDLKDAFILEMKAGIFPKNAEVPLPPVRHVIVFEREGGELVKVGGFRGNLIGMRPNKAAGAKDLLVALYDNDDQTLFNCVFRWNGGKYEFHSVENMDYGQGLRTIKGENKLETTQQIYQQLRDKSLIF